jgi:hypothetical protein
VTLPLARRSRWKVTNGSFRKLKNEKFNKENSINKNPKNGKIKTISQENKNDNYENKMPRRIIK